MTRMHCQDRARRLLAEWNGGTAAGDARRPRQRDTAEQEREELLEGIQEGLRAGGARGAVSLRLLRHLAVAHN